MKLSKGRVTQNGYWISYKTIQYGESINLYQKLAEELKLALDTKGIGYKGEFEASKAFSSRSRLNCITVKVFGDGEGCNVLPYEDDAIN